MYFSLNFGVKNTWDDWHLVPKSIPVFNPPPVKTNYIDIPGGDGALDFSEALTGHPVYGNREGSIEYILINGYETWQETHDAILNYLHGKKMSVVMEDDPDYYYIGRFSINEFKSNEDNYTITINYVMEPYKTNITTGGRSL